MTRRRGDGNAVKLAVGGGTPERTTVAATDSQAFGGPCGTARRPSARATTPPPAAHGDGGGGREYDQPCAANNRARPDGVVRRFYFFVRFPI